MNLLLYITLLFSPSIYLLSALRVLNVPPLNCSQPGLRCEAEVDNCISNSRRKPLRMTPTGPQDLELNTAVKQDENGDLVPVVDIKWRTQSDGSMEYLKGTEVHMLKVSTNKNLCIRYNFLEITASRKQAQWWFFSLDQVVVDPEEEYHVSVSNLPRPNIDHDNSNVFKNITIRGCRDNMMLSTKVCLESGSRWKPDIKLMKVLVNRSSSIMVHFNSGEYADRYRVSVECNLSKFPQHKKIVKGNHTTLKVLFGFEKFPAHCCVFTVMIQPFFIQCKSACVRPRMTFHVCSGPRTATTAPPSGTSKDYIPLVSGTLGVFIVCVMASTVYLYYKKQFRDPSNTDSKAKDPQETTMSPRKVLIIYSLDHPLYRNIVLKLCAFLRAKCGTEVILDLQDSTQLGMMGHLQWLKWQMDRLEQSSDKVLVLCSRGVQAKWQAMCGGPQLTLREDTHSPVGDMLTPALSLIIPDLICPASLGKYMVAYFEGICNEGDIPSPFKITVRYKLMKHFEDVYLRIMDKEKLEPWAINHVEGIGEKDYFICPSGEALKDAIKVFQDYQLENPDWFEKECIENEEEPAGCDLELPFLEDTRGNYALECVPKFREDAFYDHKIEVAEDDELTVSSKTVRNRRENRHPVNDFYSAIDTGQCQMYSSAAQNTSNTINSGIDSSNFRWQQCCMAEQPVPEPVTPVEHSSCLQEEPGCEGHTIGTEEEPLASSRDLSLKDPEQMRPLEPLLLCIADGPYKPREEENPYNLEEQEGKRIFSGSDRGYVSQTSLQSDSPRRDDFQSSISTFLGYTNHNVTTSNL